MRRLGRDWRYWLFGAIVVGILVLLVIITRGSGCDFDRDEWLGAKGDYEEAKPIADDLVHCDDLLYGKARAEVRAMLGERDFRARRDFKVDGWGYNIGVPGMLSDYPGLQVHFDDEGRVEEVEIPGYEER